MVQTRSNVMYHLRAGETKPEKRLRTALWRSGLRYRVNHRLPACRPDVVFIGSRVAVFLDGCFWHGCPTHYVRPRTREDFWADKLRRNVDRDRRQTLELEAAKWTVMRFWEHEVDEDLERIVRSVRQAVRERLECLGPFPSWRVTRVVPLGEDGRFERRTLEDLRDGNLRRYVEQRRTTEKWSKPS